MIRCCILITAAILVLAWVLYTSVNANNSQMQAMLQKLASPAPAIRTDAIPIPDRDVNIVQPLLEQYQKTITQVLEKIDHSKASKDLVVASENTLNRLARFESTFTVDKEQLKKLIDSSSEHYTWIRTLIDNASANKVDFTKISAEHVQQLQSIVKDFEEKFSNHKLKTERKISEQDTKRDLELNQLYERYTELFTKNIENAITAHSNAQAELKNATNELKTTFSKYIEENKIAEIREREDSKRYFDQLQTLIGGISKAGDDSSSVVKVLAENLQRIPEVIQDLTAKLAAKSDQTPSEQRYYELFVKMETNGKEPPVAIVDAQIVRRVIAYFNVVRFMDLKLHGQKITMEYDKNVYSKRVIKELLNVEITDDDKEYVPRIIKERLNKTDPYSMYELYAFAFTYSEYSDSDIYDLCARYTYDRLGALKMNLDKNIQTYVEHVRTKVYNDDLVVFREGDIVDIIRDVAMWFPSQMKAYVRLLRHAYQRVIFPAQATESFQNILILGPPGTGKTTVSKHVFTMLKTLRVIGEHVDYVSVSGRDLVGATPSESVFRVRYHMFRTLHGVLFIDEAYTLCSFPATAEQKATIDELVYWMEVFRGVHTALFAGYADRMMEIFECNPGLLRRIRHTVTLTLPTDITEYVVEAMARVSSTDREFVRNTFHSDHAKPWIEFLQGILKRHEDQVLSMGYGVVAPLADILKSNGVKIERFEFTTDTKDFPTDITLDFTKHSRHCSIKNRKNEFPIKITIDMECKDSKKYRLKHTDKQWLFEYYDKLEMPKDIREIRLTREKLRVWFGKNQDKIIDLGSVTWNLKDKQTYVIEPALDDSMKAAIGYDIGTLFAGNKDMQQMLQVQRVNQEVYRKIIQESAEKTFKEHRAQLNDIKISNELAPFFKKINKDGLPAAFDDVYY